LLLQLIAETFGGGCKRDESLLVGLRGHCQVSESFSSLFQWERFVVLCVVGGGATCAL
jgi:hypothetical protein